MGLRRNFNFQNKRYFSTQWSRFLLKVVFDVLIASIFQILLMGLQHMEEGDYRIVCTCRWMNNVQLLTKQEFCKMIMIAWQEYNVLRYFKLNCIINIQEIIHSNIFSVRDYCGYRIVLQLTDRL